MLPPSWMDAPWPGSWARLGGTETVPWSFWVEMSLLLSLVSQLETVPWSCWVRVSETSLTLSSRQEMTPWLGGMKM